MLANVDDDEKLTINIFNSEGKAHNQSFLTEDGLYEILMLSRKNKYISDISPRLKR